MSEPLRPLAAQLDQMERVFEPGHPGSTTTRRLLWLDLCERLRWGEVIAHGRLHGHSESEAIAPGFFMDAEPDYDKNTVSGPDLKKYYSVRLWATPQSSGDAAAQATEPPQAADNEPSTADAAPPAPTPEDWMRVNVPGAPRMKRDIALTDCMKATGATYREALAAWRALPDHIRGKRGAHK